MLEHVLLFVFQWLDWHFLITISSVEYCVEITNCDISADAREMPLLSDSSSSPVSHQRESYWQAFHILQFGIFFHCSPSETYPLKDLKICFIAYVFLRKLEICLPWTSLSHHFIKSLNSTSLQQFFRHECHIWLFVASTVHYCLSACFSVYDPSNILWLLDYDDTRYAISKSKYGLTTMGGIVK